MYKYAKFVKYTHLSILSVVLANHLFEFNKNYFLIFIVWFGVFFVLTLPMFL